MDYHGLGVLIGKKITGVEMDGVEAIRFIVEGREPITYLTDGDCCSRTWIEHVEGVDRLVGGTVASVEDIAMPGDPVAAEAHECLAFYGLAVKTDKGTAVIDYRNSSNGYYGGNMVCIDAERGSDYQYYYGGVFGQNKGKDKFVPLTNDL